MTVFICSQKYLSTVGEKNKSLKDILARAKIYFEGDNATRPQKPYGESVSVFMFVLMLTFSRQTPTLMRYHSSVEGSCCHFLFSCYSFPHTAHAPRLPVCERTIRLPVYHATHFNSLLTTLHFRYVDPQFDFQCVDSSATVDEYIYIYTLLQWSLSSLYDIFCLDLLE